jgi:LPS-assembly lipoprotein
MQLLSFSRKIASLFMLLLLVGCGFHLRGMIDIPPWLNNVYIVIQQANRDLGPLLSNQLQAYKVQVNPDPASAKYWLIIESDNIQRNITSVSSSTTPRQYQLIYTVNFKFQQNKGKEIIPPNQIVVTRQITINGDRILGSNDEEALLISEMRRDAAIQIINRISRHAAED